MPLKICVYAICKNEAQFVDRWMDSMSEADLVVVADTGSTDDTVERLRQRGAVVKEITVSPWRFDVARNLSMDLIPEDVDICICTDLDEVFADGNWREKIEAAWTVGTTRMRYPYVWSFNPDGSKGVHFLSEKIHARQGFRWIHPVHEVLSYSGVSPDRWVLCEEIAVHHHPDPHKPRSQYLPLLELSVAEDPTNDRNLHYLGREYLFYGRWEECIATLKRHLALPTATWRDERCASMRYIARSYRALNDFARCKEWLYRALAEAPYLREPYVELAQTLYLLSDWAGVYHMVSDALKIHEAPMTYINDPSSWDHTLYDLGAIACYRLGLVEQAYAWALEAARLAPEDDRIRQNVAEIEKQLR